MEKMNDLRDLLRHEIQDLYSAETQIMDALPAMISQARNSQLKKALQQHLKVTEQQKKRLEQVQKAMGDETEGGQDSGLFNRLFKSSQVCKGMKGIIEEGTRVMKQDMDADVMDAAIIASAQKVEHYEICGYGTAKSYAEELGLTEVAQLLEQTLNEEYEADDLLTQLAESRVNRQARSGSNGRSEKTVARTRQDEPEMAMVSASRTGTTARKTAASKGGAPSGAGNRNGISPNRTTGAAPRKQAGGTTERKTGRTGSSGSRSGQSGRNSGR